MGNGTRRAGDVPFFRAGGDAGTAVAAAAGAGKRGTGAALAAPRVGLYLRLSRDDENGREESMSISNQRAFLLGYVRERGWTAAAEYADDGWSGTTFQRPAFQRLLADIEARRIDTVVTKDLSRLGRDQIGTLYYYQVYFPTHGVRYIAVNEGVDTASGLGNSLALPFLAAANDFYTADISRKVRTALDTRRREGAVYRVRTSAGLPKGPGAKGTSAARPHRRLGGGTGVSDLSGSGVCAGDREGPYPGRGAHPGGLPERRGGRGVERHHGAPDPHQPHLRRAPDPAAHGKARV